MADKEINGLQNAAYREMEKNKPRKAAAIAFRHKPYKLDLREEEKKSGEERQRF